MIFFAEALGIDFVDILSPGRTRSEPPVLCYHFQSSDRSAISWRVRLDALNQLAGKICRSNLAGRKVGQHFLLFQSGWRLRAVVNGLAKIGRKLAVNLSGITARPRRDFGR